ncbi:MAG: hypothetical protein HC853_08905, partial [Anaerolineae bacterium]|nr:hypothetical protein [Anaerolineae bacterium]
MNSTTNPTRAKIGIFGIGLAAYWPQFEGLRERLEGYQREVEARLNSFGAEVISAGLADTAPAALAAGDRFTQANVDMLICYVGTYATSSQVLPAVQRVKKPVLVLNLQPTADGKGKLTHPPVSSTATRPTVSSNGRRQRLGQHAGRGTRGPEEEQFAEPLLLDDRPEL